jgi:TolB-like protein
MLLMVLISSGCGGKAATYHMSQDVDFSFIKRVAVLPLENMSNDKFADEIVQKLVINELLASGLVEVVIPGEVSSAIASRKIDPDSSPNIEQIKALGNALRVEGVIFGSVEKFGEVRTGNIAAPEVTITLMMADTGSGSIIWSVTKSGGGAGFWARHFGARMDTLSETVLKVVRKAVQTLTRY